MQIAVPEIGQPLGLGLPLGGSKIAALVVPGADGELSSLLAVGDTTMEITGDVTPARLPQLAALLVAG